MGESIGIYRKFKVRYYSIIHTIEGMLTPQQQPAPAYKQEEFEAFKTEVAEKLSMQQDILMKIASELGLNKNNNAKQKG